MHRVITLTALSLLAVGCGADADGRALAGTSAETASAAQSQTQALPTVMVYKTPSCGCCNGWVEHLRQAGFTVEARDVDDIVAIKRDAGVPVAMSSCHTAIVDGYVIEGHVPAEQVKRLLAERPAVVGIAVPGMPVGSPGMEGPNPSPYQVMAFRADGSSSVYADVDPR